MAKTTKKTTSVKKTAAKKTTARKVTAKKAASKTTTQRKPTTAKKSPKTTKKSTVCSTGKTATCTTGKTRSQKSAATKKTTVGEAEVAIDRRRTDRRTSVEPAAAEPCKLERREKVTRRRQIDPTTCERDYSEDEVEFMGAIDNYKRASGRMFPTCSEILEVIRELGYVKTPAAHDDSAETSSSIAQETTVADDLVSSDLGTDDSIDEDIFAAEELLV